MDQVEVKNNFEAVKRLKGVIMVLGTDQNDQMCCLFMSEAMETFYRMPKAIDFIAKTLKQVIEEQLPVIAATLEEKRRGKGTGRGSSNTN